MKNVALRKEVERLQKENGADTSFVPRNFMLKVVLLWVLYPIATVWSIFTEGSHLLHHFQNTFTGMVLAWVLTILIVIAIETGKYFFGKGAIIDVINGVFSEGMHYQVAFVFKCCIMVACFGFSIFLSIKGAPVVASDFKQSSSPIEAKLIDIAAINSEYDARIAEEGFAIREAGRMTWKGRITREGQQVVNKAQTNKSKIEDARAVAIAAAMKQNEEIRAQYGADIQSAGNWFTGLAGIGEALCLICLFFWANYVAGAKGELDDDPANQQAYSGGPYNRGGIGFQLGANQSQNPYNQNPPSSLSHPTPPPRRPIGFSRGEYPTQQFQPPVAEKEQLPTDDSKNIPIEYKAFEMAWKQAKKNKDSWLAKERQGIGRTETNMKHVQKWDEEMAYYKARMDELIAT